MNTPPLEPELKKFENRLATLRPARVTSGLTTRVMLALANPEADETAPAPASARPGMWAGWIPVAAAAGVAILAVLLAPGRAPAPEAAFADVPTLPQVQLIDGLQRVSLQSVADGTEESGLVSEDGALFRRVVHRYQETVTLIDPQTGASYEIRIPREEVRMVPVSPF